MQAGLGRKPDREPLPSDQDEEHDERGSAAQQQNLADRIGRDEPFAHDVVDGKKEDSEHHEADAGDGAGSAAGIGRMLHP